MSKGRDVEFASAAWISPTPAGRTVIAAIGIDLYPAWPKLANGVSDARGAVAAFARLGFEPAIAPLLDGAATGKAIQGLVFDDLRTLGPEDSLVLFYAGHGATRTDHLGDDEVKTGYLIPVDASEKVATWIELVGWLRAVARLPPKHILVILDACHSGIALGPIIKWRDTATWQDTPLTTLRTRRSRRIITSALADQIALDSGPVLGHSLFTGCLIEGLAHGLGGASRLATGSELGLYLQRRVETYPLSKQTPDFGTFDYDDRGELVLPLPATVVVAEPPEILAPPGQVRDASGGALKVAWKGDLDASTAFRVVPASANATLAIKADRLSGAEPRVEVATKLLGSKPTTRTVPLARAGSSNTWVGEVRIAANWRTRMIQVTAEAAGQRHRTSHLLTSGVNRAIALGCWAACIAFACLWLWPFELTASRVSGVVLLGIVAAARLGFRSFIECIERSTLVIAVVIAAVVAVPRLFRLEVPRGVTTADGLVVIELDAAKDQHGRLEMKKPWPQGFHALQLAAPTKLAGIKLLREGVEVGTVHELDVQAGASVPLLADAGPVTLELADGTLVCPPHSKLIELAVSAPPSTGSITVESSGTASTWSWKTGSAAARLCVPLEPVARQSFRFGKLGPGIHLPLAGLARTIKLHDGELTCPADAHEIRTVRLPDNLDRSALTSGALVAADRGIGAMCSTFSSIKLGTAKCSLEGDEIRCEPANGARPKPKCWAYSNDLHAPKPIATAPCVPCTLYTDIASIPRSTLNECSTLCTCKPPT